MDIALKFLFRFLVELPDHQFTELAFIHHNKLASHMLISEFSNSLWYFGDFLMNRE